MSGDREGLPTFIPGGSIPPWSIDSYKMNTT